MYKFKNSLIALIGLVSLITVATVMTPHIGYGSSGTAAPAPSTQNVNVVNTPTGEIATRRCVERRTSLGIQCWHRRHANG